MMLIVLLRKLQTQSRPLLGADGTEQGAVR